MASAAPNFHGWSGGQVGGLSAAGRAFSRTARVLPPPCGDWFPIVSGAARGGLVRACRVLVLAEDAAAAAQGGGAADDDGQRQRLAGQGGRTGLDVLAEQEHPEQAGRQRVHDGESGLGGG